MRVALASVTHAEALAILQALDSFVENLRDALECYDADEVHDAKLLRPAEAVLERLNATRAALADVEGGEA